MLLEENGKTSSSKKTRHIDIWYYFVTDHIARGKMSLAYCPTDAMVADYFTKPLQGTRFRKFRTMIMNYQDPALALMSQECVGASPPEVDLEEKDLPGSGLANSTRETSAQVQLGPGTQNPKELPNKDSVTGGSKECMKKSRADKNDMVNKDTHVVCSSRIRLTNPESKGSLLMVKLKLHLLVFNTPFPPSNNHCLGTQGCRHCLKGSLGHCGLNRMF